MTDLTQLAETLASASLVAVKMPYVDRFVRDDRRGGREVNEAMAKGKPSEDLKAAKKKRRPK